MTRILSSDILIIDANIKLAESPAMQALVDKYDLKPGGKFPLDKAKFDEFSRAMVGSPVTFTPGGSSANTLTTLRKLLGDDLDVDFYGVTGQSSYSNMIRGGLDEAGVKLLPKELPPEPRSESAFSFVLRYPNGQRTIATYPGNAREVLKSELIQNENVEKSDIIFVQGSLWQKLDEDFANKLLRLRWEQDKELWLAMPTHTKFGEERADQFQYLIPSANLVLGNDEELARVYKTTPEDALAKLQATFKDNDAFTPAGKKKPKQVGFITMGKDGAAVVTEDEIIRVPMADINTSEVKNTVGAGDTAFAGFALGYLKGLSHEASAKMAMVLAGEKVKINTARLPDPKQTLKEAMPTMHKELFAEPAKKGGAQSTHM